MKNYLLANPDECKDYLMKVLWDSNEGFNDNLRYDLANPDK